MAVAPVWRVPVSQRFREHYILDGLANSRAAVGEYCTVQLGLRNTRLDVSQLYDACRRVGNDSNLGGCAYLLQIWIWERFPVGRLYRGELEVCVMFLSLFFYYFNNIVVSNPNLLVTEGMATP